MPKIQKPWCVYLHGTPTGIGKIVGESETVAYVAYYERHLGEPWDKNYLWRFNTITAAIRKFRKHSSFNLDELGRVLSTKFPSKQKKIEAIIKKLGR